MLLRMCVVYRDGEVDYESSLRATLYHLLYNKKSTTLIEYERFIVKVMNYSINH